MAVFSESRISVDSHWSANSHQMLKISLWDSDPSWLDGFPLLPSVHLKVRWAVHSEMSSCSYLSHRSLSIGRPPPVSLINKAFPSPEPFFACLRLNSRDHCVWKSPEINSFRNTQTSSSGKVTPQSKNINRNSLAVFFLSILLFPIFTSSAE